tara:strand:- start:6653 stop:8038 length:1386 start_codon:yes stop_codon:yes gene_type:complete
MIDNAESLDWQTSVDNEDKTHLQQVLTEAKNTMFLDRYLGTRYNTNRQTFGDFTIFNNQIDFCGSPIMYPFSTHLFQISTTFIQAYPDLGNFLKIGLRDLGIEVDEFSNIVSFTDSFYRDMTDTEDFDLLKRVINKDGFKGSYIGETYKLVEGDIYFGGEELVSSTHDLIHISNNCRKHIKLYKYLLSNVRLSHNTTTGISCIYYTLRLDSFNVFNVNFNPKRIKSQAHNFNYDYDTQKITYEQNDRVIEMKAGKGLMKLAKLLDKDVTNEDIKEIIFRLNAPDKYQLKVVRGTDITKYYNTEYSDYSEHLGSLGSSCMRHKRCEYFFGLYEDNCEMLILHNPLTDLIIGRAIIWTLDDGSKFLDRIYSAEKNYGVFKKYAKNNGMFRRRYQSRTSKDIIVKPDGEATTKLMKVNIDQSNYDYAPYLDTLTYYYKDDGFLCNDNSLDGRTTRLDNLDGTWR